MPTFFRPLLRYTALFSLAVASVLCIGCNSQAEQSTHSQAITEQEKVLWTEPQGSQNNLCLYEASETQRPTELAEFSFAESDDQQVNLVQVLSLWERLAADRRFVDLEMGTADWTSSFTLIKDGVYEASQVSCRDGAVSAESVLRLYESEGSVFMEVEGAYSNGKEFLYTDRVSIREGQLQLETYLEPGEESEYSHRLGYAQIGNDEVISIFELFKNDRLIRAGAGVEL